MKSKKQKNINRYPNQERKGIYDIDEILDKFCDHLRCRYKTIFEDVSVRIRKNQFSTFKKSTTCANCKLKAEFFALERTLPNDKCHSPDAYHFSLYGLRKGEEVIFTIDHVKPRSKGGENCLENLDLLCFPCNQLKGSTYQE